MIALSPGLSPSCPREIVMPPWNSRRPSVPYTMVSPDVAEPNLRASAPSVSCCTVTPGMAAARRQREVSVQIVGSSAGLRNITRVVMRPCAHAISRSNSRRLASVQGQRGWANMTKVELVRERVITLLAGHRVGTLSLRPGMFEYRIIQKVPADTANNQSAKVANAALRPRAPVLL